MNVAPFDVRQGNFVGAGVNTVTRSGTNRFTGSVYHRFRNEDFVGTEAKGLPFNPGTFKFRDTGVWAGGPIIKNRLFAFGNYEDEDDTRPLTTFRANTGGETSRRQHDARARVRPRLRSARSCRSNFDYETGPFEGYDDLTPAKRFLFADDFNLNNSNKISFRYNHLDSSTDVIVSGSSSLGRGRGSNSTNFLSFQSSNYQILENIRSGIGEWNSIIGSTHVEQPHRRLHDQDESRGDIGSCSRSWTSGRPARPTRRSAPSRSRPTTSCATTRSSCRTTSRASATSTR